MRKRHREKKSFTFMHGKHKHRSNKILHILSQETDTHRLIQDSDNRSLRKTNTQQNITNLCIRSTLIESVRSVTPDHESHVHKLLMITSA